MPLCIKLNVFSRVQAIHIEGFAVGIAGPMLFEVVASTAAIYWSVYPA